MAARVTNMIYIHMYMHVHVCWMCIYTYLQRSKEVLDSSQLSTVVPHRWFEEPENLLDDTLKSLSEASQQKMRQVATQQPSPTRKCKKKTEKHARTLGNVQKPHSSTLYFFVFDCGDAGDWFEGFVGHSSYGGGVADPADCQTASHGGLDLQRQEREKEAEAKAKNLEAGLFRFWQNWSTSDAVLLEDMHVWVSDTFVCHLLVEAKYTCFAKIMSHFHPENLEDHPSSEPCIGLQSARLTMKKKNWFFIDPLVIQCFLCQSDALQCAARRST